MNVFLAIQSSYQNIQFGLFNQTTLLAQRTIDKKEASQCLILTIAALLDKQQISLANIPFVVVNQGPAPFTTLRVVIASMNGLSFASSMPLLGVDAFDAMQAEWQDSAYPTTVILFNAFAHEVYFAIEQSDRSLLKGCQHIDLFLEICSSLPGTIRFLGNGTLLHQDKIKSKLGNRAHLPKSIPDYCTIEQIAQMGYTQWQKGARGSNQLLPLYLKKQPVDVRPTFSSER